MPALSAPAQQLASRPERERLVREIYKQLVEINTVDSVGSVTRAAEAVARRFRAAGFPARDIHLLVPPGKPTKGNLVVRYRGRGQGRPLLLLAHLDVVAALRSDWTMDPFVLGERDGYFYGRGTSDDKAMAAIFVANLIAARKAGWVPERSAPLERAPLGAAMRAIVANPADSAAAATLSTVPRYSSILRTTCVATRLAGGHAYNALPQTASANVNCRIVPTQGIEEARTLLARALGDTSIRITFTVPIARSPGQRPARSPPSSWSPSRGPPTSCSARRFP